MRNRHRPWFDWRKDGDVQARPWWETDCYWPTNPFFRALLPGEVNAAIFAERAKIEELAANEHLDVAAWVRVAVAEKIRHTQWHEIMWAKAPPLT
jgi:hypothetical protein